MRFLKLLCLFTCAWWCWLNITDATGCYAVTGNLLACMNTLENQLTSPAASAVKASRDLGR